MPKKKVTVGRPRIFNKSYHRITVLLKPPMHKVLKDYADEHCWSVNAAVRLILEEKLSNKRIPK